MPVILSAAKDVKVGTRAEAVWVDSERMRFLGGPRIARVPRPRERRRYDTGTGSRSIIWRSNPVVCAVLPQHEPITRTPRSIHC